MQRRAMLGALGGLVLGGCGRPTPEPAVPARTFPRLQLDPLVGLVPAGGLDTLVQLRWSQLLHTLDRQLQPLLPPSGLDALGGVLGFELRLIEEVCVGVFGPTTLVVLRAPHDPERVERLFRERLTAEQRRSNEGPGVVRVQGRIGTVPRGLATLLPDVLAYEVGPPGVLRAVVGFAQQKLKRARAALDGEPLGGLAACLGDAPIRAFFPSPATSWAGAHGLLERATGAAFALEPGHERTACRAALEGAWGEEPGEALRRLELTWQDLAHSAPGHLLGLHEPVTPFQAQGDAQMLTATATIATDRLLRGLHDITGASLRELFPAP